MKTQLVAGVLTLAVACVTGEIRAAVIDVTESYVIDSAEKIAEVRASDGINIHDGATVTYSDAENPLFLNVPVSGSGTFKATGGNKLVLEADSRDFAGQWDIADTKIAVSNRYGLGSSVTKQAKFTRSDTSDYFMLWFGGNGLTNDVPLLLASGGFWALKENVTELRDKTKVAVFNGKVTHGVALTLSCYPAIYNGGTGSTGGSLTISTINGGVDGNATGMNGQWVRFGGPVDDGAGTLTFNGGNNAVVDYYLDTAGIRFLASATFSRCRVHLGAVNALKSVSYTGEHPTSYGVLLGGNYDSAQWRTAILDLHGYDQLCPIVRSTWAAQESYPDRSILPLTQVTSTNGPATLTMTYGGSWDTCTRFEGQVSVDWQGTGTYGIANHVSTSTGELKVTSGAVELKWNAGWSGDAVVTNADARLVVSSANGFPNGASRIQVANGGRVEIGAGGTARLGELTIGAGGVFDMAAGTTVSAVKMTVNGVEIPAGTYSRAGFVAAGLGDFVTGEGQIAVGSSVSQRGNNPFDALVFDLHLPTVTDKATTADICDTVMYSSESPLRPSTVVTYDPANDPDGFAAFGTPSPLAVAFRDDIPEHYYYNQNVTTSGNVLVFPKNVGTDTEGTTAAYTTPVLWTRLPKLSGSNLSVRIRFKWTGNYKQGDQWAWDQYLFQLVDFDRNVSICNAALQSVYPTEDKTSVLMRGGVGGGAAEGGNVQIHSGSVTKDAWVDYVFVFENKAGGGSLVTAYYVFPGETTFSSGSLNNDNAMICPTTGNGAIVLGGRYGQFSTYGTATGNGKWRKLETENAPNVYSGFAGEIATFQIFDRALTREEAHAVFMGDGAGMTMRVGSLNGCADEFGAADDADVAADFNARTMPPRRLRKTLDAANPSVSITCPLRPEESGLARYLTVGVLRDNVMEAPLEVRCNGQLVGTMAFKEEMVRTLYVKGRYLKADADGNIVLTLTRPAPVTGTVSLDAIRLSGGWAAGVSDGKNTDWCFAPVTTYAANGNAESFRGVIGGYRDLALSPDMLYGLKNEGSMTTYYYPQHKLVFDLPAAALAEDATATFTLGVYGMGADAELEVWCNDETTPIRHVGPNAGGRHTIEIPLPRENLKEGLNVIKIRNVGTTFSSGQQYNMIYLDNFKLTVHQPSTDGLLLIVR